MFKRLEAERLFIPNVYVQQNKNDHVHGRKRERNNDALED